MRARLKLNEQRSGYVRARLGYAMECYAHKRRASWSLYAWEHDVNLME